MNLYFNKKRTEDKKQIELLHRVILYRPELYRLPENKITLKILAGKAWLSAESEDKIVAMGEDHLIGRNKLASLISPVSDEALIFEIWGEVSDNAKPQVLRGANQYQVAGCSV